MSVTTPPIHATFGRDSARTRRSNPSTSHEAADLNDVNASIGAVLDTLRQYGPMHDEKLHALMQSLGYPYTPERVRTARKALLDLGKVESMGDKALTTRGRRTIVWRAVK